MKRLNSFFEKNAIIQPHQYGFRQKHSTVHALLHTVTSCYDAMNEKLFSTLIMVDLRKAFDTVCHKKLLKKLDHYGIRGNVNELISNYLLNRKQYVYLNGVRSSLQPINIGMPQGSILGPLLYLIYVNDLPNCLECTPSLYADDTCMIVHDQCLSELEGKVCKNISDLKVWLDSNELTLNFNKTACMLISPYTHSRNIIFNPMINGKLLKMVTPYKYLEMTVDNQLNFINHIKNLEENCKWSGSFMESKKIPSNGYVASALLCSNPTTYTLCYYYLGFYMLNLQE